MSRWHESYLIGQRVEIRFPFADGYRWVPARILRRTRDGYPDVRLEDGGEPICWVASRKGDIRPLDGGTS